MIMDEDHKLHNRERSNIIGSNQHGQQQQQSDNAASSRFFKVSDPQATSDASYDTPYWLGEFARAPEEDAALQPLLSGNDGVASAMNEQLVSRSSSASNTGNATIAASRSQRQSQLSSVLMMAGSSAKPEQQQHYQQHTAAAGSAINGSAGKHSIFAALGRGALSFPPPLALIAHLNNLLSYHKGRPPDKPKKQAYNPNELAVTTAALSDLAIEALRIAGRIRKIGSLHAKISLGRDAPSNPLQEQTCRFKTHLERTLLDHNDVLTGWLSSGTEPRLIVGGASRTALPYSFFRVVPRRYASKPYDGPIVNRGMAQDSSSHGPLDQQQLQQQYLYNLGSPEDFHFHQQQLQQQQSVQQGQMMSVPSSFGPPTVSQSLGYPPIMPKAGGPDMFWRPQQQLPPALDGASFYQPQQQQQQPGMVPPTLGTSSPAMYYGRYAPMPASFPSSPFFGGGGGGGGISGTGRSLSPAFRQSLPFFSLPSSAQQSTMMAMRRGPPSSSTGLAERPLTPPERGWNAKYNSGVTGVVWDRVHQAWVVSWTLAGKRTFRHFTCKSYGGFDKAREAAIQFRLDRNREIEAYNKSMRSTTQIHHHR